MSRKWFSSDFHLGMSAILRFEERPFKSIDKMNEAFIRSCNQRAKVYYKTTFNGTQEVTDRDTIIHVGDLCSFGQDRGNKGLDVKPQELVSKIGATFINLRGNHDINNKVKSIGTSLMTSLGKKHRHVFVCHFPSYDDRCDPIPRGVYLQLCGHVHRKWKHCLDVTNGILNINVGVDVWGYKIVSEDEVLAYAESLMKLPAEKLIKVKKLSSGRVVRV